MFKQNLQEREQMMTNQMTVAYKATNGFQCVLMKKKEH